MPCLKTARGIVHAIASGEHSCEEIVRDCLGAIGESNHTMNAFLSRDEPRALRQARDIDHALARGEHLGPLAGVPVAIKDNLCTAFGTTTCASRILERFPSRYSAYAVDRLESAGAVIVGKTNLDEFAMGSSAEHSAFGPTQNPWDLERVAGGSSGGSAAAVAGGLVPVALGTDTGGSVRLPAAFCGVVGLKPSYGRVSRYGLVAFGSSLDQVGTVSTTVEDAALMLSVIAGHDPRDSTSVSAPVPDYVQSLNRPLKGLCVGVAKEYLGEGLDAEIRQAVLDALALLEQQGAAIVEVELPHMGYAVACYYIIAPAEASSNLARYDGVHFGHRTAQPANLAQLYCASRGEGFGAEVKRRIMLGTYVLSSGYYDQYYLKAMKVRTLIRSDFQKAFDKVDVIASPVAPTTAFRIGERTQDPLAMYLADVYTLAASLAGICAMSLPCGFDAQGLPIGLQLMGPPFGEEIILAAAHQYQLRTDFHQRRPPALGHSPSTQAGEAPAA